MRRLWDLASTRKERLSKIFNDTKHRTVSTTAERFFIPLLPSTPPKSPSKYCHNVRYRKTGMVWWKSLMICLAVFTQYRRVTDRQTDEWTDGLYATAHSALRYTQHSAVKIDNQLVSRIDFLSLLRAAETAHKRSLRHVLRDANKLCKPQQTSHAPHCRVLPPGKFNGIISVLYEFYIGVTAIP